MKDLISGNARRLWIVMMKIMMLMKWFERFDQSGSRATNPSVNRASVMRLQFDTIHYNAHCNSIMYLIFVALLHNLQPKVGDEAAVRHNTQCTSTLKYVSCFYTSYTRKSVMRLQFNTMHYNAHCTSTPNMYHVFTLVTYTHKSVTMLQFNTMP